MGLIAALYTTLGLLFFNTEIMSSALRMFPFLGRHTGSIQQEGVKKLYETRE